jgi:hypothetical protein
MVDSVMIGSAVAVAICVVIIVFLGFKVKTLVQKDAEKNK